MTPIATPHSVTRAKERCNVKNQRSAKKTFIVLWNGASELKNSLPGNATTSVKKE